jgi:DNA invertase Pin-like site-specific DNA recombinase
MITSIIAVTALHREEVSMGDGVRVPAATYLRMSTERQQYSLANQSEVIAQYAEVHGFTIVKNYLDAARTGVVFRKRKGLQKLIQDVVQGAACFKAVLVYDVSRWGRFQDTDESAHYEFLCKSAGIPVHYCAESFSNDTGLSSLIMKSLKRVMAGEYSRELGVKIFNAQQRLAAMGFRQGGQPGYGLRRLLVSVTCPQLSFT